MHPKYCPKVCPLSFVGLLLCIRTKGKHTQSTLLVVKASIWGVLDVLEIFVKGQPKWPITKPMSYRTSRTGVLDSSVRSSRYYILRFMNSEIYRVS